MNIVFKDIGIPNQEEKEWVEEKITEKFLDYKSLLKGVRVIVSVDYDNKKAHCVAENVPDEKIKDINKLINSLF